MLVDHFPSPQGSANVDMDSIFEWIDRFGVLLGALGLGSLGVVCRRWLLQCVRDSRRNRSTLDSLHIEFGDNPVAMLADAIRRVNDIEAGHAEHSLRIKLAEQHLSLGVFIADIEGSCTWANDWLRSAFGLPSLNGLQWLKCIDNAAKDRVYHRWKQSFTEGIPYQECYEVHPQNGQPAWRARTEAWPVRDANGSTVLYLGYVIEDTECEDGE